MGYMGQSNLKFFYPLLGFASGVTAADFISYPLAPGLICISLAILVWLAIHVISRNPVRAFRYACFHPIWIILLFAGIGLIDFFFNMPSSDLSVLNNQTCRIEGEITKIRSLADGDRISLKVTSISDYSSREFPCRNLNILLLTDGFSGSEGDIISFKSKLSAISEKYSHNPDYASQMRHRGLTFLTYVKSDFIKLTGYNPSLKNLMTDFREKLEILIEKSSLNRDTGDFLISVLLGDKYFLSQENRETFSGAGLAHILALSGMHVAIIITILSGLLFPLSLLKLKNFRIIILLILLWVYVFLTGSSASTVRAAIMASLLFFSLMTERKNSALNSLLAAVLIILLINPLDLWDIGLQLSFLCVAAILIFSQKLNPAQHHSHPWTFKIIALILISVITSFTTWTLVAYYFKNIPLLFLPSNFIIVPFLPLFIGIGLFYTVLLFIGLDPRIISWFLDSFYDNLISLSSLLSARGSGVLNVEAGSFTVALWLCGLFVFAIALSAKTRNSKLVLGTLSSGCFLWAIFNCWYSPEGNGFKTLVFPHSFTAMETRIYSKSSSKTITFKRSSVSKYAFENKEFLAIDCPIKENSMDRLNELISNGSEKFLILGSNAEPSQIASLKNIKDYNRIILHSSVGKNKKQEFLNNIPADIHNIVFSSRENGSLEIDL